MRSLLSGRTAARRMHFGKRPNDRKFPGTPSALRRAVLLIGLAFLCRAAEAQPASKAAPAAEPDVRVKKLLDRREVKYETTPLGAFKVVFELKGGRRQSGLIRSVTYKVGNLEVREILSPAYRSAEPFTADVANRLLTDNNDQKLGAWEIQKESDGYYAIFVTKIPADSDEDTFFSALKLTLETADAMELELTGRDEF